MDADLVDVPDLVPARMVNEFAYCPRLFHLEWVQTRWTDNPETAEGRYAHRYVDKPAGAAPLPDEGALTNARSLALSSASLGLSGVIDVVEGEPGEVAPVERKRGSAPAVSERSWEPERVQLCTYGLLLREAGYVCRRGYLVFADSRERVPVEFDDALVLRTTQLLEELRLAATQEIAPPPLVDSPKCPRCSLVGICLPDETNALNTRTSLPLKRLLPRDPAARPVYVSEQGTVVGRDKGRLEIRRNGDLQASVRLIDVSQLCVFGSVQITTGLIRELFAREVPVCWFSYGGWFSGMATGLPAKDVEMRRSQVIKASRGGLDVARLFVEGKIRNSRTLLRRNSREKPSTALHRLAELAEQALIAATVPSLLGIEGAAARTYFQSFTSMLRAPYRLPGSLFTWEGRNRRPPLDALNCLLSYAYSLLVKDLTVMSFTVGLDPYLGFYHRPRFGRPALALDLAEEFRPLICDSLVLNLINNGEVGNGDFLVRAGGVSLTREGRRSVLSGYERRLEVEITHPVFGYKINYRRVLDVQTRLLAGWLMGEVPSYVPFTTR